MRLYLFSPLPLSAPELTGRPSRTNRLMEVCCSISSLIEPNKRLACFAPNTGQEEFATAKQLWSILFDLDRSKLGDSITTDCSLEVGGSASEEQRQRAFTYLCLLLIGECYDVQNYAARGYHDMLIVLDPCLILPFAKLISPRLRRVRPGEYVCIKICHNTADISLPLHLSISRYPATVKKIGLPINPAQLLAHFLGRGFVS